MTHLDLYFKTVANIFCIICWFNYGCGYVIRIAWNNNYNSFIWNVTFVCYMLMPLRLAYKAHIKIIIRPAMTDNIIAT